MSFLALLLAAAWPCAAWPVDIESISPAQVLEELKDSPSAPEIKKSAARVMSGLFGSAPNLSITPGVLCTPRDRDFAEYRYPERIPYCRRNFSTDEKKIVASWYGVPWEEHSKYQFDHLLSLCLGGSNSLHNLWPMPVADAEAKAKLEFQLCERLKRGEVTQAQAVREELSWFQ